jgi:hypothetical protein
LEAVFILLEVPSPSRTIFIGSHSLPPSLVRRIGPSKRERREDDDDESRRRKKLEKGKEPAAKDANEDSLFYDNKFAVELLRSALRKLEGVGEAFDIKVHHDAYKDPTLKGLAFRIHGLAGSSKTFPWSSGQPTATSSTMAALTN